MLVLIRKDAHNPMVVIISGVDAPEPNVRMHSTSLGIFNYGSIFPPYVRRDDYGAVDMDARPVWGLDTRPGYAMRDMCNARSI